MFEQEVANNIIETVMAQGELARKDALRNYDLKSDELDRIKQLVVSHEQIQLVRGGFRLRPHTGPVPEESANGCRAFEEDWKNSGTERLRELLRHEELENLIGHLAYTIRQSRALRTGVNRRGNKMELATALVIRYEEDLFSEKKVREVIAEKVGIAWPKRWVSGKETAIKFVKAAGFPVQFAGVPVEASLPDYEYLVGRTELGELADFQYEVRAGFLES